MIAEWLKPLLEWSGLGTVPFLLVVLLIVKIIKD